jgi:hypothetical protein
MGFIILFDHTNGTCPFSKQTLKILCKTIKEASFLKTSVGIQSIPDALPNLAFSTALITSKMLILAS